MYCAGKSLFGFDGIRIILVEAREIVVFVLEPLCSLIYSLSLFLSFFVRIVNFPMNCARGLFVFTKGDEGRRCCGRGVGCSLVFAHWASTGM
jgi:hypothetical protein